MGRGFQFSDGSAWVQFDETDASFYDRDGHILQGHGQIDDHGDCTSSGGPDGYAPTALQQRELREEWIRAFHPHPSEHRYVGCCYCMAKSPVLLAPADAGAAALQAGWVWSDERQGYLCPRCQVEGDTEAKRRARVARTITLGCS